MSKNTPNGPRQNPPAENSPSEPWTLRQAANWILFRDFNRAQRVEERSLRYAAQDDPNFPKRREEESDAEISARIEVYLKKQNKAARETELARSTDAQAELIESLKNSKVKALSLRNDGGTVPADAWKIGARTFFTPGDARVYSDAIMARWKPNRPTQLELTNWMAGYLDREVSPRPDRFPTPHEVWKACQNAFGGTDNPSRPRYEELRVAWNSVPSNLKNTKGRPSTKIK